MRYRNAYSVLTRRLHGPFRLSRRLRQAWNADKSSEIFPGSFVVVNFTTNVIALGSSSVPTFKASNITPIHEIEQSLRAAARAAAEAAATFSPSRRPPTSGYGDDEVGDAVVKALSSRATAGPAPIRYRRRTYGE